MPLQFEGGLATLAGADVRSRLGWSAEMVLSIPVQPRHYAASLANWTGSTIEGSSFSGLLTRVEIGHIRIRPAGNGRIRSRGSGSSLSHRVYFPGANIAGIRSWISA